MHFIWLFSPTYLPTYLPTHPPTYLEAIRSYHPQDKIELIGFHDESGDVSNVWMDI